MIRWCAYCQRFLGEVAPYENYAMTHGMCAACEDSGTIDDDEAVARIRPIRAYYEELRLAAKSGVLIGPRDLLRRGLELGVEPTDLALGMLQPVLYEVGDRWARRLLTVTEEHQVSGVVAAMFDLLYQERPELDALRRVVSPEVLVLCADGNAHDIGVKLLQLLLVSRGISTFLVPAGVAIAETVALVGSLRPKILGISVSLEPQLRHAYAVADAVRALPAAVQPKLVVGGGAIVRGAALDPSSGLIPITAVAELVPLLAA